MRNRGFFWFLTILLAVVSIYQISYTFVSNSVEKKVEQEVDIELDDYISQASKTGDTITIEGTVIDFRKPEGKENARVALINKKLKELGDAPVYPVLGSSFATVKQRSMAFGLDLVGGMSVTMEINIPELVKNYAQSERNPNFRKVFDAAIKDYTKQGGDFIKIFYQKHTEINKGLTLVSLFSLTDNEELNVRSSDQEVLAFLNERVRASMNGIEEIIDRRVNQFGVSQPNIQKDEQNNRLYVELPGVQDEKTVASQLQATANLQFFETYTGQEIANYWETAVALSTQVETTLPEQTSTLPTDSTNIESTGQHDSTELSDLETLSDLGDLNNTGIKGFNELLTIVGNSPFAAFATIEDRTAVDQLMARADIKQIFPQELRFMWSADPENLDNKRGYVIYAIKIPITGKARVGGKDIQRAMADVNDRGQRTVNLRMTAEGAEKWAAMTAENIGKSVAITMDNIVYSAPVVQNVIQQGNTEITGNFSFEESTRFAGLLNGGALPAPCVIKEQVKVGPTVGAENAHASMISFAISLLVVLLYVIFYYGKAGRVASIVLIANILFIFGTLASFGAVLTLAGIAGIVLSFAMAIDANVLIYERVREELALGKDQATAINDGFRKSLNPIIDANVTSLLTAIILKVLGSGPIESFAITLIIGIFTQVFSALVITKLIFDIQMRRKKQISFDIKLTKDALKNTKIDFAGRRKIFYWISGVFVLISCLSLFTKGLNPSVEFSGGRTYVVKFENSLDGRLNDVEREIRKSFDSPEASIVLKTKTNSYNLDITTNYLLGDESANNVVLEKLEDAFAAGEQNWGHHQIMESRTVSPTISEELTIASIWAVLASLAMMFAYIFIRFGKWQYSVGTVASLGFTVVIILGVFSVFNGVLPFNMDVDQAFIAAILTVVGYAINDTVVVFDRIRENIGYGNKQIDTHQINLALNSTLSRTFNTGITVIFVLIIMLFFGGLPIRGFIFAQLIGVIVGTYASLFIATPVLIDLSAQKKSK